MNVARDLLGDLAVIGATIKPAGDRLILRAGHTAIPAALVNRVREAKVDLLAALAPCTDCVEVSGGTEKECGGNPPLYESKNRTFEARIVEWLDQHPAPTTPGRCGWCGSPESPGAVVLPFGVEPGKHAWLHAECWPIWYRARTREAITTLTAMGLAPENCATGAPRQPERPHCPDATGSSRSK
jgi:hypothetical protein